jgi:RNA polymerase sigma factor
MLFLFGKEVKTGMIFQGRRPKATENSLEETIKRIQSGDNHLRDEIIEAYQPFVKKVVSKVCHRFIDHTMDEFSIGLVAFDQAIDQYKEGQGSKFLTFADLVIRRRVIDYIRKEARRGKMESLDQTDLLDEEQPEETLIQQKAALDTYENERQIETRVEQIDAYQSMLQDFGITFLDLSKSCPKHLDARENAKQVAKVLATDKTLSKILLQTKQLPTKDLLELVSCSRKTIERNRKYIIAIALIHLGEFNALRSYIEPEARD